MPAVMPEHAPTALPELADFDTHAATLAELAIAVGVNLQRGQALVIRAPLEAEALVRHLTEHAYRRGASVVTCVYEDPAAFVARLRFAEADALDSTAAWLPDGIATALRNGAAFLHVLGPYPDLLDGVPLERTLRLHRSIALASQDETAALEAGLTNASSLPFPTRSWARTLDSGDPHTALRRLGSSIIAASRASTPNPVDALSGHLRQLDERCAALAARDVRALHCRDGETDLRIGLAFPVRWAGGTAAAANGTVHAPSLIAESVTAATDPHAAEGRLKLTRPLALPGGRVVDACLTLERGRVVSVTARAGQAQLEQLLAADDHAARIGEIGLVPASSPLARHGMAFLNPLLDRGSGCHIAFGRPDPTCVAAGARDRVNRSALHVDAVFGRANLDVDGIDSAGKAKRIMTNGEFVI